MSAKDEAKFLVITAKSGWEKSAPVGDSIKLATKVYPKIEKTVFPFEPEDFAIDCCGTIYALVENGRLAVFDRDTGHLEKVGCLGVTGCKKIAVAENDIYLVKSGVSGDTLICLARVNYQVRWEKPGAGTIADMASCVDNTLFILVDGKISCWCRKWGTEHVEFESYDINSGNDFGLALAISCFAGKLFALYYYREGKYSVRIFDEKKRVEEHLTFTLPMEPAHNGRQISFAVAGFESFFISDGVGTLFRIETQSGYLGSGYYVTVPLDSTILGCLWHRVVIDCEMPLPDNTRIELSWCASDDISSLSASPEHSAWSPPLINPLDTLIFDAKGQYIRFKIELFSDDLGKSTPVIRNLKVEFPHHSYLRYLPAFYQEDAAGREFLRRFLSIFESLFKGSEETIYSTPRYLDPDSAPDLFLPWLAQWLALPFDESLSQEKLRKLIKAAPELRRTRGTRQGLETLIKIYTDKDEFSVNFQKLVERCTKDAEQLKGEYLRFVKQAVIIIENFQVREFYGKEKGSPEEKLYGIDPYSFCILFKPYSVTSDELLTVRRFVELEKPAHTTGFVKELEPWFYLGGHTYLGINTMLTEPRFILGESALSRDTAVNERERAGQVAMKSIIGMDSILL